MSTDANNSTVFKVDRVQSKSLFPNRKTPNRHDSCMIAQEKLHPACAQRPPESLVPAATNGVMYSPPPSCHAVAEMCREDEDCRARLEVFEQSCAVDSVTKKCAGKTSGCRQAMLGILGTPLRTNCACQGSDLQQLYDCLGWQRLLWLNPCVGKIFLGCFECF